MQQSFRRVTCRNRDIENIENFENLVQMYERSSEPLCYTSVCYFLVFQLSIILRGFGAQL